jgi:hypothetical protein
MHWLLRRAHPWPHRDGVSPGIVEREPHRGVIAPAVVAGAARAIALAFPLALALTLILAFVANVRGGGKGPPEDSVVPTEVGMVATVAAAEGANLLSAWSRTQRPVPRPLSCPA